MYVLPTIRELTIAYRIRTTVFSIHLPDNRIKSDSFFS